MCDELTYLFQDFTGENFAVWEWTSNLFPDSAGRYLFMLVVWLAYICKRVFVKLYDWALGSSVSGLGGSYFNSVIFNIITQNNILGNHREIDDINATESHHWNVNIVWAP